MKSKLNATTVRIILSLLLFVILIGMAASTYFAYSFLSKTSEEVVAMQTEATAVEAKAQDLLYLEKKLDENSSIVKKAEQIVAESKSYQYQNQIINDLSIYAVKAGVPIKSFTFEETSKKASSSGSSTSTSSSTSSSTTTSSNKPKSVFVSIQLADEISYNNLLHFLQLIEKNVTRMQVSGVSIASNDKGGVTAETLELEVYVK